LVDTKPVRCRCPSVGLHIMLNEEDEGKGEAAR